MAQKNYIRLDRVSKAAHYESVVLADAELVAGQFVELGTVLDTSEGEAIAATAATAGGELEAIVCPVYLDKGIPGYDITEDAVAAGKPARALHPVKGTIISINAELAKGVVEGDKVAIGENGLGFQKAAEGLTAIGKVIALETLTNVGDLVVIRF